MLGIRKWYIPLCLLLITAFAPLIMEFSRVSNLRGQAIISIAPVYSIEKTRSERAWIGEFEKKWDCQPLTCQEKPKVPEYWEYRNRKTMLIDALQRFLPRDGFLWSKASDHEIRLRNEAGTRLQGLLNHNKGLPAENLFRSMFGQETLEKAKPVGSYVDKQKNLPEIANSLTEKFGFGYLLSIPVMFLVFVVRLRVRKLLVWPELWRLIPISIVWPIGLVIYPRDIKRENQLKLATHFVAQLASLVVGLCGFGPLTVSVAKAQPTKVKPGVEQSEKKSRSSFGYGLEVYPQSAGIDAGLMVSPWYAHSTALAKGFSLSGFGFVEAGERKGQLFTNHSVNISHEKSRGAMFTTEVGGAAGLSFVQVGPRFNLVKVPGFPQSGKKVVKSVVAGSFWRIRGPTHYQEHFLGWASQEARLPGNWRISTEGFMRFRPGPRPAVGQPQIILRHPQIKHVQFMLESWMIGTQPTIRLGLQFSK